MTDKLLPEAITLSCFDKEGKKFGVAWQTEVEGNPVLQYTSVDDTLFSNCVTVHGRCAASTDSVKNYAEITGLRPGEKCLWRVGDECGIFSESAVFTSPLDREDESSFLLFTDTQDGENHGEWWKYAWKDAAEHFPDSEFFINAGDTVQEGGNRELWADMFEINKEYTRSMASIPTTGNHDYWYGYLHGFDSVFFSHYNIDIPPQDTRHGIYYSVDRGCVHFTVLSSGDSMETDGHGLLPEQLRWCEDDLSSTDKKWKIVVVHNPLYSPGKYGSRDPLFGVALSLREQLNSVFAKYGVDLVFCGHDHVLSKSYPIKGDSSVQRGYEFVTENIFGCEGKVALSPEGPIHFESGCAGNQNREVEEDMAQSFRDELEVMENMTYACVAYSSINIKGDTLRVNFRKISVNSGECVDEFAFGIRK